MPSQVSQKSMNPQPLRASPSPPPEKKEDLGGSPTTLPRETPSAGFKIPIKTRRRRTTNKKKRPRKNTLETEEADQNAGKRKKSDRSKSAKIQQKKAKAGKNDKAKSVKGASGGKEAKAKSVVKRKKKNRKKTSTFHYLFRERFCGFRK